MPLCHGPILICNLLPLFRAPDFHNLPSDFTQQISLPRKISFVIFAIFSPSLPIKQIVSQTSHSRLPGVLYWCCALFAVCHPTALSLSPLLPSREQSHFSSQWWRWPKLPVLLCFPLSSCTSAHNHEVPPILRSRLSGQVCGERIHTLQSCNLGETNRTHL